MAIRAGAFSLEISGCSVELRVASFLGEEGISRLYRVQVDFISRGAHLDPADIVGRAVSLGITFGDDSRTIDGVVLSLSHGPASREWARHQLVLGPPMRRLELRHDCRIFQEMTVPKVISEVLQTAGLSATDFRLDLRATYDARVYCVQYRESDWQFISRLLEEEGIFYYFEYQDGAPCMVLADDSSDLPEIPGESTLAHLAGGVTDERASISSFRATRQLVTNAAALGDFDFRRPTQNLSATSVGADTSVGTFERFDYPGGYDSPSPGARRAKRRLEASLVPEQIAEGDCDCARLLPGTTFTLEDIDAVLRPELLQSYLVVGLELSGEHADPLAMGGGGSFRSRFRCIPASTVYRPPLVTPRPAIHGVQTAIVTGNEEIYVDEFGRIKVQFHWDRLGKRDERSSCWIRVSQPWAGDGWGAMFLPRRGQEVIVSFIEGDPDRPIVTGRVYNGDAPVPYSLPADRTRSTIMSRSSPDASGANELRFEDLADKEEVYLHAQKDWTIAVENDKNQTIGHDETLLVKHDRTTSIENNQSETIGVDKAILVKGNHVETIEGDMTLTVNKNQTSTIDGDVALTIHKGRNTTIDVDDVAVVKGDHSLAVTGKRTETVDMDLAQTIVGAAKIDVKGNLAQTVGGTLSFTVTGDTSLTTDAGLTVSAVKDIAVDAKGKLSLDAAQGLTVASKAKAAVSALQELSLTCGAASITLKASGEIVISGLKVTLSAGGELKLSAPKISGG